jgi:hypothetical protein
MRSAASSCCWRPVSTTRCGWRDAPPPRRAQRPAGKRSRPVAPGALIPRCRPLRRRLSARRNRAALSAKAAAQAAFFDEGGHPDEAGQALLAETGLHPPGAWVKLACGEIALVMKRQTQPARAADVVSLVNREGLPLAVPAVRSTALPKYQVEAGVPSGESRVQPNLEALQKLVPSGAPAPVRAVCAAHGRALRLLRPRPAGASASDRCDGAAGRRPRACDRRDVAGVVPQQPPAMFRKPLFANSSISAPVTRASRRSRSRSSGWAGRRSDSS